MRDSTGERKSSGVIIRVLNDKILITRFISGSTEMALGEGTLTFAREDTSDWLMVDANVLRGRVTLEAKLGMYPRMSETSFPQDILT